MKITQKTPTILKLEVRKNFKTLLIGAAIGLGFSLTGLIVIIIFGNSTTLNCNRLYSNQINCKIIRKNWLKKDSDLIQVTDLKSAEIDVKISSYRGGKIKDYEIILIAKNSRIPLMNTYSSGLGFNHEKQNQLINSFIKASAPDSLTVQHDMRLALIIGLLFMLVSPTLALYLSFSETITICIFDRDLNQLSITKRNILRLEDKKIILSQVKKVMAMKNIHYGCIIKLFILEDEDIELRDFAYNRNKLEETYDKYNLIAQSINHFLEIDSEE